MTTTSEYGRLQAQCHQILNDLHVPRPYSLDGILHWVEDLRQRPLVLKELPRDAAGTGACGLWLSTDETDFVFYEARTAPLHQEHIILHEVGHMLSDHHDGADSGLDETLHSLLSGLQPHLIRRLMARTRYSTDEERRAEMLASLMHSWGEPPRPVGAPGRLGAFLGVRADDGR
ncbi:regulator component [Streptomyces sp. TS71-3]|uniref:regulator component n=1 Tax=Streptomyces sp. TS71-3 TaxID=2733862 RepID=UPI001BB3AD04|nr:regulator component [Streptomyces sp. TS71-3]